MEFLYFSYYYRITRHWKLPLCTVHLYKVANYLRKQILNKDIAKKLTVPFFTFALREVSMPDR